MILTFHFSGKLFREITLYDEGGFFAKLTQKWHFYHKMLIQCMDLQWEVREHGILNTKLQVYDLLSKQVLVEVQQKNPELLKEIFFGLQKNTLASLRHQDQDYFLVEDKKGVYAWITNEKECIIQYDLVSAEAAVRRGDGLTGEGKIILPDNHTVDHLKLLFLGIFLIKIRLLNTGAFVSSAV